MPDEKQNQDPGQQSEPPVYASPVKRAWAWVGISYMPITLATFTYYLATARILTGIGPLLLCPRCGAGSPPPYCAIAPAKGGADPVACAVLTALCAVLLLLNLGIGIPALLRNFGG